MLGDDFVVNQFYGIIGTRLAFGEGNRYKEVSRHWRSYEYGELDVCYSPKNTVTKCLSRGVVYFYNKTETWQLN